MPEPWYPGYPGTPQGGGAGGAYYAPGGAGYTGQAGSGSGVGDSGGGGDTGGYPYPGTTPSGDLGPVLYTEPTYYTSPTPTVPTGTGGIVITGGTLSLSTPTTGTVILYTSNGWTLSGTLDVAQVAGGLVTTGTILITGGSLELNSPTTGTATLVVTGSVVINGWVVLTGAGGTTPAGGGWPPTFAPYFPPQAPVAPAPGLQVTGSSTFLLSGGSTPGGWVVNLDPSNPGATVTLPATNLLNFFQDVPATPGGQRTMTQVEIVDEMVKNLESALAAFRAAPLVGPEEGEAIANIHKILAALAAKLSRQAGILTAFATGTGSTGSESQAVVADEIKKLVTALTGASNFVGGAPPHIAEAVRRALAEAITAALRKTVSMIPSLFGSMGGTGSSSLPAAPTGHAWQDSARTGGTLPGQGGAGVQPFGSNSRVNEGFKAQVAQNPENIFWLAWIVKNEMGVGNEAEQAYVAYSVLNRMAASGSGSVQGVISQPGQYSAWNDPRSRDPEAEWGTWVQELLACKVPDNTGGYTHYYSPRSMKAPKAGRAGEVVPGSGGQESAVPPWVDPARTDDPLPVHPNPPGTRPWFLKPAGRDPKEKKWQ